MSRIAVAVLALALIVAAQAPAAAAAGAPALAAAPAAAEPSPKPSPKPAPKKPAPKQPPPAAPALRAVPAEPRPTPDCPPVPASTRVTAEPWAQQALDFSSAWPLAQGQGITVAVVDSGVDYSPQLTGKVDAVDVTNTGFQDCVGHGTAVAAIIAARDFQAGACRSRAWPPRRGSCRSR